MLFLRKNELFRDQNFLPCRATYDEETRQNISMQVTDRFFLIFYPRMLDKTSRSILLSGKVKEIFN